MILIGPKIVAASKVLLRNPMLNLFESPLRVHLCVYGNHLEWEPPKELQRSQGGEQPGYPTKIFAVTKYWKKIFKNIEILHTNELSNQNLWGDITIKIFGRARWSHQCWEIQNWAERLFQMYILNVSHLITWMYVTFAKILNFPLSPLNDHPISCFS